MRHQLLLAFAIAIVSGTTLFAQSDREQLIGTWHLVSIDAPGSDGKLNRVTGCKGQLIYTRDGHMSVQLMYPPSQSSLTNDYVFNGYEASYGTYDVDEAAHTVTHHVQASVTRGLVGKSLARSFQISNGDLIINSVRADEHWSVTWRHD
ncbi:MAG: lipocalin-like domain-containing protein [Acidobacteria bacterium]|nr:lipocalin-like domain-containing protein [Acidobacteriota bacterium]